MLVNGEKINRKSHRLTKKSIMANLLVADCTVLCAIYNCDWRYVGREVGLCTQKVKENKTVNTEEAFKR